MLDFITRRKEYFLFAFLLLIIYFPIFLHLDYMPFRIWDESILGVNAIEMSHNHNYIVTYFYGNPDMSNCKPPLMIWCIVLFSKVLGFNELSVRLPSALGALCLSVYLFFTLKKCSGSSVYAFLTIVVLITCQGYIRNHVTRTGEYDSLLVLFSTIFSLKIYQAVNAIEKGEESKYIFAFFIFLTLGVLTKGVACLMQLPAIFVYVALNKKIIPFLKTKAFYGGLFIFLLFGIGYYFLRESLNPGYLKAVWDNELGGRYGNVADAHTGDIFFYLREIINWQFVNYLFVFPVGVLVGCMLLNNPIRKIVIFSVLSAASFLLIISLAATKIPHYDAPLFPYLAIIVGAFFYFIYAQIKIGLNTLSKKNGVWLVSFVIVLALMAKPYADIISRVYFPKGDSWEEGFSISCRFFQMAARHQVNVAPYKAVLDIPWGYGSGTVLTCYNEELQELGIKLNIVRHEGLLLKDSAVVFDPTTKRLIEQEYDIETIRHIYACDADIIYVKGKKESL